jgi:hypothetical protein
MRETRRLYGENLRKLCIEHNWFTNGTNEDYARVLKMANDCEDLKTENIVNLSQLIKFYSETEYEVKNICFEIARICHSIFEEDSEFTGFCDPSEECTQCGDCCPNP